MHGFCSWRGEWYVVAALWALVCAAVRDSVPRAPAASLCHRYETLTHAVTDAFRCILVDLPGCGESRDVSNDADVHTISS